MKKPILKELLRETVQGNKSQDPEESINKLGLLLLKAGIPIETDFTNKNKNGMSLPYVGTSTSDGRKGHYFKYNAYDMDFNKEQLVKIEKILDKMGFEMGSVSKSEIDDDRERSATFSFFKKGDLRENKRKKLRENQGSFPKSEAEVVEICAKHGITTYQINDDFSISVTDDVDLSGRRLTHLPLRFKAVAKDFDCTRNKLKSLEGSPQIVGGDFHCFGNKLESLEGGPKKIKRSFSCTGNNLKSLKGSTTEVGGDYYCGDNYLTSLEGCPETIPGTMDCEENDIVSLKGGPQVILLDFHCRQNRLKSLDNLPEVGGDVYSDFDDEVLGYM